MEYMNPYIKDRSRLIEMFLPNIYYAYTLSDFINNREGVEPTRKWWPLILPGKGKAQVWIPHSFYEPAGEFAGKLYDAGSEIGASLHSKRSRWEYKKYRAELMKAKDLFDVELVYDPKTAHLWLYDFKTHGPPEGGEEGLEDFFRRLLPIPAPAAYLKGAIRQHTDLKPA